MEQPSFADLGQSTRAELETLLEAWSAGWPAAAALFGPDRQELDRTVAVVRQLSAMSDELLALDRWLTSGFFPPVESVGTCAPDELPTVTHPGSEGSVPSRVGGHERDALASASGVNSSPPTSPIAGAAAASPSPSSLAGSTGAEWQDRSVSPPPNQAWVVASPPAPGDALSAHGAMPGPVPELSEQAVPDQPAPQQSGAGPIRRRVAPATPDDQRVGPPATIDTSPPDAPLETPVDRHNAPLQSLRDLAHLLAAGNPETAALTGLPATPPDVEAQPQRAPGETLSAPASEGMVGLSGLVADAPSQVSASETLPEPAVEGSVFSSRPTVDAPSRRFPGEQPPPHATSEQQWSSASGLVAGAHPVQPAPDRAPAPPPVSAERGQKLLPAQGTPAAHLSGSAQLPDLDSLLEALAREIQREYQRFYEDT